MEIQMAEKTVVCLVGSKASRMVDLMAAWKVET